MSTTRLSHIHQELTARLPGLRGQLGSRWPAFRRRLQGLLARAALAGTDADAWAVLQALADLFAEFGLALPSWPTTEALIPKESFTVPTALENGRPTRTTRDVHPVSEGDVPDPAALAQALDPRVTRYLDVYCPRQVNVREDRFPISVGLTRRQVAASAVAQLLHVWPGDEPVTVFVRPDPAGFAVLGESQATLTVYEDRDSPPATFYLQPLRTGAWDVTLEFHQRGRWLGAATLRPTVVPDRPAAGDLPQPRVELDLLEPGYLPVPDVDLRIRARGQGRATVLEFEVTSPLLGYWAFDIGSIDLTASPAEWQANEFDRLSRLAGGAGAGYAELKRIGQRIYRDLFPPTLQALYENLRQHPGATILITSDEPWIPWELAWPYDVQRSTWEEDDPLGIRYRVGRWLASGRSAPYRDLQVSSLAVVAPSGSGLPHTWPTSAGRCNPWSAG